MTRSFNQAQTTSFNPGKTDLKTSLASALFGNISCGQLTVRFPNGLIKEFSGADNPGLGSAVIELDRWTALSRITRGGAIGLAESYMDEDWSTPDLSALLLVLGANMEVLEAKLPTLSSLRFLGRIKHWLNRNTKAGSKRNIAFHYDLGNAFYELWLDQTMTYSAALFESKGMSFEEAQLAKYRAIAFETGIRPGDHVLEIGCGWGGFAEFAAKELGCHVTGLTLSREQKRFAEKRIKNCGLERKCKILLKDYRDMEGQFDHIVSIEMLEAVGQAYWPTYFDAVKRLLKPGGRAGIQVITIADDRFEKYSRGMDFIQKYIFPGGMLPSDKKIKQQFDKAKLSLKHQRDFPEGYERTLKEWHHRFLANDDLVKNQGFDERFMRMWRFYLSYCEVGFALGTISVSHYVVE